MFRIVIIDSIQISLPFSLFRYIGWAGFRKIHSEQSCRNDGLSQLKLYLLTTVVAQLCYLPAGSVLITTVITTHFFFSFTSRRFLAHSVSLSDRAVYYAFDENVRRISSDQRVPVYTCKFVYD